MEFSLYNPPRAKRRQIMLRIHSARHHHLIVSNINGGTNDTIAFQLRPVYAVATVRNTTLRHRRVEAGSVSKLIL
jgi:hypothetical protein